MRRADQNKSTPCSSTKWSSGSAATQRTDLRRPDHVCVRRRIVCGHSADGLKITMMRANPHVCFEVDHRENLANWRSVVAWGV
jgi:hypothetical protein